MRKRRKKNILPESKDQRIAELEEQLAQALATIQQLQKLQYDSSFNPAVSKGGDHA